MIEWTEKSLIWPILVGRTINNMNDWMNWKMSDMAHIGRPDYKQHEWLNEQKNVKLRFHSIPGTDCFPEWSTLAQSLILPVKVSGYTNRISFPLFPPPNIVWVFGFTNGKWETGVSCWQNYRPKTRMNSQSANLHHIIILNATERASAISRFIVYKLFFW